MLTGWPPPELLVTVIITSGTRSAVLGEQLLQRVEVHVALERVATAGWRPFGDREVDRLGAQCSMLARVVSKWVLFGTISAGLAGRGEEDLLRRRAPGGSG